MRLSVALNDRFRSVDHICRQLKFCRVCVSVEGFRKGKPRAVFRKPRRGEDGEAEAGKTIQECGQYSGSPEEEMMAAVTVTVAKLFCARC